LKIITHKDDTIVAPATLPGQSALAVVRMSGSRSFEIIKKIFKLKNKKQPDFENKKFPVVLIGEIFSGDKFLDEVVINLYRAPKSYTGEDLIEISCHGSPYIVQQLLNLIIENGARMAESGEFTFRAFMNGKMDLTKAESVAELIHSESGHAHEAAVHQYRGDYKLIIQSFRDKLVQFLALLELELDFSEEDVEFARRDEFIQMLGELEKKMQFLYESYMWGNALKKGIPVVILGKPNAGKSTLMNALAREEKSIVSEIPGTTRDLVEDVVYLQGIPFRFTDTAGLRQSADVIEQTGVRKALEVLNKALMLIYLFDVNELGSGDLAQEIKYIKEELNFKGKVFWVGNKSDLMGMEELKKEFQGKDVFFISAKTGEGVDDLRNLLVSEVQKGMLPYKDQIVTNARHAASLAGCLKMISVIKSGIEKGISTEFISSDIRQIIRELDLITGTIVDEDILSYIFSNFCIGK
jgi:tRNA modification GTPase